ncbi:probable U3 small nucleolar RNA-associated protein 11 [Chrysoperla carnea]|uniref:probable U3 small nucleolar RNA-associated protein 11 n=1 Tax=Chrysoperla carnea TaxID=189513 RepID=UPI001D079624|nr:probable U3 small nucleolar RNA-associated protein 11 [Chrysoperla carnea]
MSSWKKASKINQKTHRERHQPESRKSLGLLEKHSDYKKRAEDFQEKRKTIALLKKRAQNRNPDEFYHHMIRSKVEDGIHKEDVTNEEDTPEQIKLMRSQDLKYITHKRVLEANKIKKLQAQLHLLDTANKTKNSHIFFVDDDEGKKKFNLAKQLETHPDLVDYKINRPSLKTLEEVDINIDEINEKAIKEKESLYKELKKRILREKELAVIQDKLQLKKNLQEKKHRKPVKVKDGSNSNSASYVWAYERKR